ncbi:AAA family ATPase [Motilibacter sp. E257]|uniref:AAA family ATPase n=1 Tax=Motilibacter deserti TaxID=2714956 RepID=A0ABX0H281_9ACTN|nr:AAA family ATPase [Motilibacter deserti]
MVDDEGNEHDSKALLGAAHGFAVPHEGPLLPHQFSGGAATVGRLTALGFQVSQPAHAPAVPALTAGDCALFSRYPDKVPFKEENLEPGDKEAFQELRLRLQRLAQWLAATAPVHTELKAHASLYSANGRTVRDLWSCVFPERAGNKSYALQVAIIVSENGAEVTACLGAGTSALKDEQRQAAERELTRLKGRLAGFGAAEREQLTAALPPGYTFRHRWREDANADFDTLDAWLAHAASPEGNGAGISRNLSPQELQDAGPGIAEELAELLAAVAPLFDHCYPPGEGTPALEDLDEPAQNESPIPDAPRFDAETLERRARDAGLLIDLPVYRAVVAALASGKHLILTGPPGTAKTTLAELTAQLAQAAGLAAGYVPTTATADWTTYETIGGLRPRTDGPGLQFREGILLSALRERRWLIIDELNRANFDRALGQMFTVLSGQSVVLPYQGAHSGNPVVITPEAQSGSYDPGAYDTVAVPADWRIIATMNVFDKSLLFEMSFALMRRFAFVEVPAPSDTHYRQLWQRHLTDLPAEAAAQCSTVLDGLLGVRTLREIGPATYLDMARFAAQYTRGTAGSAQELTYQLFYSFLLPQLEGADQATVRQLYTLVAQLVGSEHKGAVRRTLHTVLGVNPDTAPRTGQAADGPAALEL